MDYYNFLLGEQDESLSDSDVYSADNDDITTPEANNHRMRQAMNYIKEKGRGEELSKYRKRIMNINKYVVRQYQEEGYEYDQKMHESLKRMVEQELDKLDHRKSKHPDHWHSLHRSEETEAHDSWEGSSSASRPKQPWSTLAKESLAAIPKKLTASFNTKGDDKPSNTTAREIQWLYGGPRNETEKWHANFAPSLPFGETFVMQEWESMKMEYDLRESAKRKAEDSDPIVTTNAPYFAADLNVEKYNVYDSGSRFSLPVDSKLRQVIDRITGKLKLGDIVAQFNRGQDEENQIKKDYAPRVFLEHIVAPLTNTPGRRSTVRGKHSFQTDSYGATRRRASDPTGSKRQSALEASRRPSVGHPTRGTAKSLSPIQTRARAEQHRSSAEANRRSSAENRRSTAEANRKSSAEANRRPSAQGSASRPSDPKPTTTRVLYVDPTVGPRPVPRQVRGPGRPSDPKPTTTRVLYVDPAVRPRPVPRQVRGPGRPPKTPTPPAPAPPRTQTKRKLAEAEDSYDEASKRKQAKAAGGKKSDSPRAKPQAKPTKETPLGPKAAGYEQVKRGTTRSGRKFKG